MNLNWKTAISCLALLTLISAKNLSANPASENDQPKANPQIDFAAFNKLSQEVEQYRSKRLISTEKFLAMAKVDGTIILDTRSKAAFDKAHIKGAVHLNFSDFTEQKLAKVLPEKTTRILIYCNNNFTGEKKQLELAALVSKGLPLALNIPTFTNLYGYGYKNVYELGTVEKLSDTDIPLVFGNS